MAPQASSPGVRDRMRRQRRRDTSCEMKIRSELHRRGFRYFVDARPLRTWRRRADIVFPRARVAVFVDGCFWHGCPHHPRPPKSNAAWWSAKLARNRERDAETNARLAAERWEVIRVWEHDDPAQAVQRIATAVMRRRAVS